jgi:hypothetical protein
MGSHPLRSLTAFDALRKPDSLRVPWPADPDRRQGPRRKASAGQEGRRGRPDRLWRGDDGTSPPPSPARHGSARWLSPCAFLLPGDCCLSAGVRRYLRPASRHPSRARILLSSHRPLRNFERDSISVGRRRLWLIERKSFRDAGRAAPGRLLIDFITTDRSPWSGLVHSPLVCHAECTTGHPCHVPTWAYHPGRAATFRPLARGPHPPLPAERRARSDLDAGAVFGQQGVAARGRLPRR